MIVTWVFSVGSMVLLGREKKERGVRYCIDNRKDDVAVDLLTSMHNIYWI